MSRRTIPSSLLLASVFGLLVSACGSEGGSDSDRSPGADVSEVSDSSVPDAAPDLSGDAVADVAPSDTSPEEVSADVVADLGPDAAPPAPKTRPRRRMDISQLRASLAQVTGGLQWAARGRASDRFEELGPTLGVPDYIQVTLEDLVPGLVFQKFLGDSSRSLCTTLFAREFSALSDGEALEDPSLFVEVGIDTTFETDPEAMERNMSYLLLRYHGLVTAPGDPQLDPWMDFIAALEPQAPDDLESGLWRTVCVALVMHPGFYTY